MAPKTLFSCEKYGAANFSNAGALATHQKNGKCKFLNLKRPRVVLNPLELQREAENITRTEVFIAPDVLLEGHASPSSCSLYFEHERLERNSSTQEFDSTVHLLHFIRHCRNQMGLSRSNIDLLLKTLFDPLFELSKVAFRTILELEQYEDANIEEDEVWIKSVVSPKDGDLDEIILYSKNPLNALSELFSVPSNGDKFKLWPNYTESYTTPDTGKWWIAMQNHVNSPGSVIAGLIFYSDQTTLSNDRRVSGWPLIMSLANIACENRGEAEGHVLLAILPIIKFSPGKSAKFQHDRVLEVFQQCLAIILDPLKPISYTGLRLLDPFGTPRCTLCVDEDSLQSSNKRAAMLQIVNHNRRLESLRKLTHHMDGFKNRIKKERVIAWDRAVSSGENVLSGAKANLRMKWVVSNDLSFSSTQVNIPFSAKNLLNSQPELQNNLYPALNAYMSENNFHSLPDLEFDGGMLLHVYNALGIPAGPGERFGDWPMYIHATNQFFGAPWYSSIAIQMEEGGNENIDTSFGESRLLFKLELRNANNETLSKELALVKMYEEVPQSRIGRLIDCVELGCSKGQYLVVEVAHILRAIHVLPNFVTLDRFFVNAFKF